MPEIVLTATLCCGCGICETFACCQGISPRAVIANYKVLLGKNRMKYVASSDSCVSDEREYRMVPSEKWERTLGVNKFDRVAVYAGEDKDYKTVEIMMSQHIGAPSVSDVKAGDIVSENDVIAVVGNGLSLPQHASISGKVISSDGSKIIIERME